MVAIVSGNSLGLELTSQGTLGSKGAFGLPGQGSSGEQVFVNAATGNLVLQRRDDFLASRGGDTEVVRTYNSLGQISNGNWWVGAQRIVCYGTANAPGSTIVRTARDGSQATYAWDAGRNSYLTREGDGAHDTITYNGSSYERIDGSTGIRESYSLAGKLTAITDPDGNQSTYEYNAAGLLSKVADSSGETVWYDYDTAQSPNLIGVHTEFKDGTGATVTRSTVRYAYDTSGRLASVTVDLTPADGSIVDGKVYTTSYTYDGASNRIKTLIQSEGSALTFTYVQDSNSGEYRVATITDALGAVTAFGYDGVARRTTVVDAMSKSWLYDYDAAGQLIKVTSPATNTSGQVQTFRYDVDGNLVATVNGDGETVTMAYDANGNQIEVVDQLGNAVRRTYSQDTNRLLTETRSTLTVPAMHNLSGVTIQGGAIVKTAPTTAWDAAFRSSEGLTGRASVGFVPAQADKGFMVGLTTDPGTDHSYRSIDYALYCNGAGALSAYENGVGVNLGTGYVAGDSLRVTYDGTNVIYLKNGVALRTVAASVVGPLFVDSSFYHSGARLTGLSFGVSATEGAVPLVVESNATITTGGSALKTGGGSTAWDASIRSLLGYTGGAVVSFQPGQADKYFAVGLTTDPAADDDYRSIDYAIYCNDQGSIDVYENGVRTSVGVSYQAGDILQVVYDGSAIKYVKNGVTILQRTVAISAPLYLDSSFYSSDSKVTNLKFGKTDPSTVVAVARESGTVISGDAITKLAGTSGAWDSSVSSDIGYVGQAHLTFSPSRTNKGFMMGLNSDPSLSSSWTKLDWAFYCTNTGTLEIRESGSTNLLQTPTTYAAGDQLQIVYDGEQIRYFKNGQFLRGVAANITQPLYMDSAFQHIGATVTGVRFSDHADPNLTARNVYAAEKGQQLRFNISAEGRVTQYLYNNFGELVSKISYPRHLFDVTGLAAGDVPTEGEMMNWVSSLGDLSSAVREDFIYDARGLLRTSVEYDGANANGVGVGPRETRYVYDPAGRLLQSIRASGSADDEAGSPTTTYTYDGLGRLLTASDARGALTSTLYLDSQQKAVTTYQSGAVSTSFYDRAGRLTSVARSDAGATANVYDAAGRLLMTTDSLGVRSFRIYDEVGRMVGTVDGDGSVTEYIYDWADRVVRTTKFATGVDQTKLYDSVAQKALNPAMSAIRPVANTLDVRQQSVYDDAGRLVFEIGDGGAVTEYEYDGADRVVKTTRYGVGIGFTSSPTIVSVRAQLNSPAVLSGAATNRVARHFYDGDGLLIGVLDPEGYLTTYAFDQAGRRVESHRYAQAVPEALRAGGVLSELIPNDDPQTTVNEAIAPEDQIELWFYNARGLQVGHVDAEGFLTYSNYNGRGLLADQTRYATRLNDTPAWTDDIGSILEKLRPGGTLRADDRKSYRYYALDDQLAKSIDFNGTSTTYEYDARGLLLKSTVGAGLADARISQARYDAWGRKVAELSGEGSALITSGMSQASIDGVWASEGVDLTYDSADRLTSRTDANGNRTLYFYDADGRLTHTVNARGEVEEQQYNALGQRTALVRYGTAISLTGLSGGLVTATLTGAIAAVANAAKDSKTTYAYTGDGLLQRVTGPTGAQSVTNYNVFGEAVERLVPWQGGASANVDPRQDLFVYDRRGMQTLSTSDAAGVAATVASRYDAFGRVIEATTNGNTRKQVYDRLGRVVQTTDALNKSGYTTYDAFGQVLTTKDELGKITTYAYDRANHSVTMTTPEGVKITTVQTRYGQTYSVTNGRGITTVYSYDLDGNLTQTKTGNIVIETREYDRGDRLLSTTDVRGIKTAYTYDAANRVLTRTLDPTDPDAGTEVNLVTTWAYDAKGQAITVTDPRGTATSYTFDLAGNTVKQVLNPTGLALTTQWTYDAQGHVLTVTDPKGVRADYVYDELGRRISETVDAATGGLRLQRLYSYDADGNVLTSRDPRGMVTRYRYDSEGRLTYIADPTGAVTLNAYDAKGQLVKQTRYVDLVAYTEEPSAVVANANDQVTRYAYDDDGRLEYTVDALGAVTKNEYDANGNLLKVTRYADTITASEQPTAVVAGTLDQVTRREYDSLDREIRQANAMGEVTRSEYDLAGNLIRRTRYANTVSATAALSSVVADSVADRVERFVYDAAGRETWRSDATGAVTQTAYDRNGNVTEVTRYATLAPDVSPDTVAADPSADRRTSYFYDAADRVTYTVDALGYVSLNSYDANGNVTKTRRFADLPDSRSTPSSALLDDTKDRVQTYAYDNANRVVTSTDALGQSEKFTYDGAGNKLTYTNRNGAVWTYTYDQAGRLLTETAPAVGLNTLTQNATTGGLDLSTTVSVAIVTTLGYDSFGNLTSRTEADGRPQERTTRYEYDLLNRQVKVTYPGISVHSETSTELAVNTRLGEAARDEVTVTPTVQTWYDVFGNAVASVDRVGAIGYKTYDAAGRVEYEIDALGYITQYVRNAFGEATTQRRYANASSLAATAPTSTKPAPTGAEVDAVIAGAGFTSASDRSMTTRYDKNGRVDLVMEPVAYVYNSLTNVGQNYGARTYTLYNAFGEPVRVGQLYDYNAGNLYQYSYNYYDLGGRRIATANPLGYLSTYSYDSEGNLTKRVEYSTAMASGSWNLDGYALPTANSTLDRTTVWAYDKLNRKVVETQASVTYYMSSTSTSVATSNSNLTTSFGYDAVGNLIWTQDAAGGFTRTYYDALGRIRAVVAPSRSSTVDGTAFLPLVQFYRDAHGNVLAKIERANSATSVTDTSYAATSSSLDHATKTLYDSSGNARKVSDALGYQHYNAYTADGKIAKSWQTVTDLDGAATTLYVAYGYDKLGRLVNSYTPSPEVDKRVATNYQYNAFGELTARGKNSGWEEYFLYDNAGRMWKTNSDGGDATVYLYDLLGRRTAEISSAGSGRSGANDVSAATSASQAAAWTSVRRVDIKYDRLGNVIERAEAERQIKQGGITARTATAGASITARATSSLVLVGMSGSLKWSGTNKVQLSWATLAYLGSGDVRVDLDYDSGDNRTYDSWGNVTSGSAPVALVESQVFTGNLANTGVSLQWTNEQSTNGGISAVNRLRVYKRDVNGEWFKVVDRGPDGVRSFSDNGTQVEIGSPVDPATAVTFYYKKTGTTTWTVVSNTSLTKFGDSHWFDASSLTGTYDYQVKYTEKDGVGETTETGTFTAETNDTDDGAKSEVWDRPVVVYTRDRWGNALTQSDPRNRTWLTVFTYNRDNQVTSEKRPDPSSGDQTTNSPTRTIYYDKLGRQAAVLDERGYVNAQEWDAGGNLVKETHADAGRVTHFYDAFGQKVRSVDAVGNKSAAGSNAYLDHTTVYEYDKLGRLLSTTHGARSAGAVNAWVVNTSTWLAAKTASLNIEESQTYDEAGRTLTQVNGNGETTRYWYDRANNLVKSKLPGLQTTTATFDIYGHKISERDANGYTATWDYDYFGRLEAHTDIGAATYTYTYDAAGQLKTQTNSRGQNLTYYYDAAGQLIQVTDAGSGQAGQTSTTAYDLAGRHLREKVVKGGVVYQDNHLSYDTLGRLVDSADNRSHLTFSYDKANNRTRITTRAWVGAVGDDDVTSAKSSTRYFLYDSMNRQTVVDGVDAAGAISATQGHKLTYDVNGNRITDTFFGNKVVAEARATYTYNWQTGQFEYQTLPTQYHTEEGEQVTETYTYDAMNRLQVVDRDSFIVDQRLYDAASRVVQSGPVGLPNGYASALNDDLPEDEKIGFEVRKQLYNANGWLLEQRTFHSDGTGLKQQIRYQGTSNNEDVSPGIALGYDGVGNVKAYEVKNIDGQNYVNTSTVTLKRFEGYAEAGTSTDSDYFQDGTSTSSYDANGYLVGVDDTKENTLDRTIVNDAAGRALRVTQNGNSLYTHIVNGEILGQYGVGVDEVDPRTSKGAARFAQVADFEFGYRYISGSYPSPTTGTYTVQQGDNLKSIAQAAWGDSSQWWRIAQANNLQGDRDLRVGQTLTMPSVVAGESNNATTFKPYNPSDVIGDTSPNLPQPKGKHGCGPLAQIVMLVVAVAVTYFTAGAASTALGSQMAGAAVGAAAGSVASQAVGIAMDAQDSFSWKQVAMSAIGGGVTGGLSVGGPLAGGGVSTAIARAAVANAMTQGIGIAVGAQNSFSWMAVASAAVGAGIGEAVNEKLLGARVQGGGRSMNTDFATSIDNATAAKLVTGTLAGLASGAAVAVMRGGRVSVQQVAADAFGNALGSSLADAMQPTQGEGPWSSADYRNGSDIDSDNAYYDRMTQQALQRGGPGLSDSATNAEVMAYRMREAGFDGDMVPTGGAMPAGPGLTVKPRPLAFKPLPQLNEETGLMGFDQGNGVWSYPVPDRPAIETRPLGAAGSVSLPQVENLYTPLEGFFEGRYRMALEGLNDPNASLLDKTYYAVAGAGALPLAILEAPVTGLYNAGNNAWRGGQNLARADMTSDPDVAVMSRLEATVNFAGAALGLGGPATLIEPRLSLGTPATRTGPIADDMLADNFTLGNSHPTVTLQVRTAADVNQAMVDAGNLAAWGGRTVTTEVVPAGTRFNMVVSEGQAQALMAGKPAFGAWATPDAVTSQAFARNNLAILPEFKPDVSMVVQVETTASQSLNRGLVGALRDYAGGANQVEFLGARNLRMVGQPQPLPPGH